MWSMLNDHVTNSNNNQSLSKFWCAGKRVDKGKHHQQFIVSLQIFFENNSWPTPWIKVKDEKQLELELINYLKMSRNNLSLAALCFLKFSSWSRSAPLVMISPFTFNPFSALLKVVRVPRKILKQFRACRRKFLSFPAAGMQTAVTGPLCLVWKNLISVVNIVIFDSRRCWHL